MVRNISSYGSLEKILLDAAASQPIYDVQPRSINDIVLGWFRKTEVPLIIVSGFMGSGKTDIGLKIGESVVDLGYKVVTNIETEEFDKVNTYENLIKYLHGNEGQKLFIYDEAGVSMDSRRSSSSLNVALSHFVILARKFKAGIVVIVQDEDITDIRIRALANVLIHKKRAVVTERFDREINYQLVNISKTNVVYDTYDVAAFSLGLSEKGKYDAFEYLGNRM